MLSNNALRLLEQRYFKPGEDWPTLVKRNVNNVVQGSNKEVIEYFIRNRVFIPNSPGLVNAGTKTGGLFACFTVGPTEDTLESSFQALHDIALVAKKGGGCGFSGSVLRPENSPVAGSAHGYAYGPNRFAKLVSYAMDAITQAGFRKMALMYTLSCEHPDAKDFIYLKQTDNEQACYNFNQSLMATDAWMNRALSIPGSKESELLDLIAKHAWNNGEPGLLFEDTLNTGPYQETGQYIYTTNPCSEQGLPPYGSCNLASINLNHEYFNQGDVFSFGRLEHVVRLMVTYLDDVGTANQFPTQKHKDWYEKNRPIGIGIMGFADLLLRYEIKYGSEESADFLNSIMQTMYTSARLESEYLGVLRGVPEECKKLAAPRRNITLLSIAPTGSIAQIADCSHSIEPIFSPVYRRIDERGEEYVYEHPLAKEDFFVSAVGDNQPTWEQQIDLVSVAQKWVDSGVSKTINMPNSATVKDVKEALVYAWSKDLKGITVYRDGSRDFQILNNIPTVEEGSDCKDGSCSL